MATSILETKLYAPPIRPDTVSRPRLIERLNVRPERKVTLISAPAGYGKTTLAAEWLRSTGRPLGWLLLDIFVFRHLFYLLEDLEMWPRIFISALLLLPLGFFMGMPFPKGTLRVGSLVDWGFAVNGAASVLGSTVIIIAAFTFGYQIALLFGAACYLAAFLLISLKSAW